MTNEIPTTVSPRFLSSDELRVSLPIELAMDALARRFKAGRLAEQEGTPRTVVQVSGRLPGDEAELLLMPAHGPEGAGVKLVSIVRGNPGRGIPLIQGLYVLLGADGMAPELVIEGAALTGLRTAAVSALATKHLARPDSTRLVVFGAGAQAAVHVEAMRAVLPIEHVTIIGRSNASPRATALVTKLVAEGIDVTAGDMGAVSEADVICTCTTSTAPVFSDHDLRPGTHVNAIGAYRLDMCELPSKSLARALLVVESIAATLAEAGDVVRAIDAGALPEAGFAYDLHQLLNGAASRTDAQQITIFKSVGLAVEDLIVARAAAEALSAGSL